MWLKEVVNASSCSQNDGIDGAESFRDRVQEYRGSDDDSLDHYKDAVPLFEEPANEKAHLDDRIQYHTQ
jgi:hypothetical protein